MRPGPALVLLGLFAIEAIVHTYYPRPKAYDIWANPPDYMQALAPAGSERVFSAGVLPANAGSVYGIAQLDSLLSYNSPRVFELYRRYANPLSETFLRNARDLPPEGVLDGAAIEFLAFARDQKDLVEAASRRRGTAVWYEDDLVRIFRRAGVRRFFFTTAYETLRPEEALVELAAERPAGTVLLEAQPSFPSTPNGGESPKVEVVRWRNNSYRVRVDAPRPGLVYDAEGFMPGWTATVNGHAAVIQAANYAFRAVEVPAGVSEIEFRYWPPGMTAGLAMTCMSVVVLVLLASGWRFRPANHAEDVPS